MTAPKHAITVPDDLPKLVIAVETGTVTAIVKLVGEAIHASAPTSPEQAEHARSVLVEIQKLKNKIEKERKHAQAPFKDITDQIMEAAKGAVGPLEQAQGLIKAGLEKYLSDEIAAAAAQRAHLAAAAALAPPEGRQTPTLAVLTPAPRPAALSTYTHWEIEVTNPGLVPVQYMMPNMPAIHEAVKNGAVIPGVSAKAIQRVASR